MAGQHNNPTMAGLRRIVKRKRYKGKEVMKIEAGPPKKEVTEDNVKRSKLEIKRVYKRKSLLDRVYALDGARQNAIKRAKEIQSALDPGFPSFVKPMTQSHVTGGFWLGLPSLFCKKYLPKEDTAIILIDENLDPSQTLFLADKNGLSAGWRGFAISHGLVDGDAVVFHLVNPTTFKVYIIRASDSSAATKAKDPPKLDNGTKRNNNRSKTTPVNAQPRRSLRLSQLEHDRNVKQGLDVECSLSESLTSSDTNNKGAQEDPSGTSVQKPRHEKEYSPHPSGCCFQCFRLKEEMRRKAVETETAIKENEELRFFKSCKVCMESNISILLLPCKHICLCKDCEPKLHMCPICNTAKVSSIEVFMS